MSNESNKKVLIYMDRMQLRPIGGPIGYNYNLMKQLSLIKECNICYLEGGRERIQKWKDRIDNIKSKLLRSALIVLKKVYKHWRLLYGKRHNACTNLDQYELIHFHSTLDMFDARDSLENYKGKVVLTTHSPTLLSKEIYDGASWFEKNIFRFIYKRLIRMDEYAFERADYIIFPCIEAEEPYEHAWEKFEDLKKENKSKFRYLPTGINECRMKISREEVREKYHIPKDAFLISYVGRHNEIKGYDILKSIGKKLLEKDKKIYIIVAGKEAPIKRLEHERWIEVGWTDDPHSIIGASDLFVLPNRETYFDLVLLEVLSLGKMVIASATGGNKLFNKYESKSIQLFSSEYECCALIEEVRKYSEETIVELEKESKKIFSEHYTCQIFCEEYVKVINSLLG